MVPRFFIFKKISPKICYLFYGYSSRAVYRISLSFRGPQRNRYRLIGKVSVYLQDRSNCHITLLTLSTKCSFILTTEGSLVDKIDLQALHLCGTCCHKTGTNPLAVKLLDNRLYMTINF